ncbi:MAG: class I SAM-dependent methyltransferase [Planctomycetes bacterium]|nr:class I SAM-dependent methyltransferase [Planctomycetota bacterium]
MPALDRFDLYELCVQSPREAVQFLERLHGGTPRSLREDFCGTAAIARAWAARSPRHTAEAVDCDPQVLERAGSAERVERLIGDVRTAPVRAASVDVVFVGNYSIGEIHERSELVAYLSSARRRLRPRGVFVCDTYGGESAFRIGALERRHAGPNGTILHHVWEQRAADPLTARVENVLHFRVELDGEITLSLAEAFVYRWRLWSIPELVDAAREAGFVETCVHTQLGGDGDARALHAPCGASFAACLAARVD